MAYGRLSVARKGFFDEAILVTYRPTSKQPDRLPPATSVNPMTTVSREIYRAQVEAAPKRRLVRRDGGQSGDLGGHCHPQQFAQRAGLDLANSDARRTDIPHEYFIPTTALREFLVACREIIPPARAEFLNVTLRYVEQTRPRRSPMPSPRIAAACHSRRRSRRKARSICRGRPSDLSTGGRTLAAPSTCLTGSCPTRSGRGRLSESRAVRRTQAPHTTRSFFVPQCHGTPTSPEIAGPIYTSRSRAKRAFFWM